MDINEVILAELRELRATVEELATDSKQRITRLEAQTLPLFDNGQPGRCTQMEVRVRNLEHWRYYIMGAAGAISALVVLILRLYAGV